MTAQPYTSPDWHGGVAPKKPAPLTPTVGRIVHYVSRGSADGVYEPGCRAAIVTEVHGNVAIDLCVLNPEGLFFNQIVEHDNDKTPGSYHWPELSEITR